MILQLVDVREHSLYERTRRIGILECNIVGDGVQIAQRWVSPDYFSHRLMRRFASA